MICFNPRTREGYDRYRLAGPPQMYSFNPRTHKKYDQPISGTDRLMYALIPVPMKGTITVYYDIVKPLMSFNPRTHEGYDHDFFTNEKLPFNSFNPRTREGYDTSILLAFFENIIFIPVPMKGTILIKLGFPK